MMCVLCTTPLDSPESKTYQLCVECRLFPAPNRQPRTDHQHDEAVELVQRLMPSTIRDEAEH